MVTLGYKYSEALTYLYTVNYEINSKYLLSQQVCSNIFTWLRVANSPMDMNPT